MKNQATVRPRTEAAFRVNSVQPGAAAAWSERPDFLHLIEAARAEERARIARDIHDELGAVLMAIKIELKCSAKSAVPGRRAVDQQWSIMLAHVDAALGTVARIAEDLRPSIVDRVGLRAAIKSYVRQFEDVAKIPCRLRVGAGDFPLQEEVAADVFRIVQEALINVARHAEASQVDIGVGIENGRLKIRIADDGKGIAPAQVLSPHSVGIAGMFERARLCGGKLQIQGQPGSGTTVTLQLAVAAIL
jgi:signal transduction histidine kinase